MKARTKLQFQVTELSLELPRITQEQESWAFMECLPHIGYANKKSAFCLDCGETFSIDIIKRNRATCPHCKSKLTIERTKKRTHNSANFFAITHVVDDFQVVENFEISAYYKKGQKARIDIKPILEDWILPNGKIEKIGLLHTTSGYCDSWGGDWEIRQENKRSWSGSKYDVYARKYHPDSKFKPEYSKYGINHNLSGLTFIEAIKLIPRNSKLETLIKAKQYSLLAIGDSYRLDAFWPSIKICLRNKYKVKDYRIYIDYLELLKYFKKDLRNAMYVCPKDLKKAHDYWMKKKREVLRLEEIERERLAVIKRQENLEKATKEFTERMNKFFGLEFKKGPLKIIALKSVEEFKQEGDLLEHCVFTNEYYAKKNSLILSARINGKPIETIEVSLTKFKIEQSRGLKNTPTDHHDNILKLVKSNLPKIAEIVKPKKRKKSKQLVEHE